MAYEFIVQLAREGLTVAAQHYTHLVCGSMGSTEVLDLLRQLQDIPHSNRLA